MQKKFSSSGQYSSRNYTTGYNNKRTSFGVRKKRVCYFCSKNTEPDYKNISQLKNYVSDKGKILSSKITKTCTKHQRRVTKAIKRARMISLIPFVDKYRD